MAVTFTQDARTLTARLSGELDHHTARSVMEQMEEHLGQGLPEMLVLDLSGLHFTDSSGIAVLLRSWKQMQRLRGSMKVVHAPEQAQKVFRAAGLQKMIPFEQET